MPDCPLERGVSLNESDVAEGLAEAGGAQFLRKDFKTGTLFDDVTHGEEGFAASYPHVWETAIPAFSAKTKDLHYWRDSGTDFGIEWGGHGKHVWNIVSDFDMGGVSWRGGGRGD